MWNEYESLLDRDVWSEATTDAERRLVLSALAGAGKWIRIFYGWRPNLPDEADNHLIELAVAGQAKAIITHNVRDLATGELRWSGLEVMTPAKALEKIE